MKRPSSKKRRGRSRGGDGVLDVDKNAETQPLVPSPRGGGGGSVMGVPWSEPAFLQLPVPTFIDSPYGLRYLQDKPRGLPAEDIGLFNTVWLFDITGYWDYGTFNLATAPVSYDDGNLLLKDWYPQMRDMGKRALKYKHVPTTLTDYDMLKKIMNVYHDVVADTWLLLNINRLNQWNTSFGAQNLYLTRYMSRIVRLWRRLSTIKMPRFLKTKALMDGTPVHIPGRLAPVLRFWMWKNWLASASGGPVRTQIASDLGTAISTDASLAIIVANLETAERWLESGAAAIITDFTAVKDLIDMTHDIVPGSFEAGLPKSDEAPGVVVDPQGLTEVLCRGHLWKEVIGGGIDKWKVPIPPSISRLGGRTLVLGFGSGPTDGDFTLLGNSKFCSFNASISNIDGAVDSDFRFYGTDTWVCDYLTEASLENRDAFGMSATRAHEHSRRGPDGAFNIAVFDAFEYGNGTGSFSLDYIKNDSVRRRNVLECLRFNTNGEERILAQMLDRVITGYRFVPDANDLCENYAEMLGRELGIPYV